MQLKDFEKMKDKLEKEYTKNIEQVKKIINKLFVLDANTFENKFLYIIIFSIIPYFLISLIAFLLRESIILSTKMPILIFSVSTLIGITSEKMFHRKARIKEKLQSFSNAKTYQEILEEKVLAEIEKIKLLNKNKILKNVYDKLSDEEEALKVCKKKYNITNKDNNFDYDEKKKNIKEMNILLEQKNLDLDKLTALNVLDNKFNNKFEQISRGILISLVAFACVLLVYSLPLIVLKNNYQNSVSLLEIFIPSILSVPITCGYSIKRGIDQCKVYKKVKLDFFNKDVLKESDKNLNYVQELNKVIEEMSIIKLNIEEENIKLESVKNMNQSSLSVEKKSNSYQYKPSCDVWTEEELYYQVNVKNLNSYYAKKRIKKDEF